MYGYAVESRSATIARIIVMITTIIMVGWNTTTLHDVCNNTWMISVVKAMGIQCLSIIILGSISSVLTYWVRSEKARQGIPMAGWVTAEDEDGEPVEAIPQERGLIEKIADFISPSALTGMMIQLVIAYVLFNVFTKSCEI